MKDFSIVIIALLTLCSMPLPAVELLQGDEQSFETGVAPGRWQTFTWPDTRSGGFRPSPLGGESEGINGADVTIVQSADAPTGWGSNCLAIYDTDSSSVYPDCGGVMITLDVLNGATYTVSAHIKFATDVSGYHSAAGFSIDTDGGTDPLTVDYGHNGAGGGVEQNEFDPLREVGWPDPIYGEGEWAWNGSWYDPGIELQWWGPSEGEPDFAVKEIAATGDQMTIFLWAFDKWNDCMVLFDGISVEGPPPPPPPTPSTGIEEWSAYR